MEDLVRMIVSQEELATLPIKKLILEKGLLGAQFLGIKIRECDIMAQSQVWIWDLKILPLHI